MPEVLSIGLGGGSRVRTGTNGQVTVGPDSVAHRLTTEAMVFGGSVMTSTDIVVAAQLANVGDVEKVKDISDKDVLARVEGCWQDKVYYTLGGQSFAKNPVRGPCSHSLGLC